MSLRGIGVLNADDFQASGEDHFLLKLQESGKIHTIVDVGANTEAYGVNYFPDATIFALEPHPETFKKLVANPKNKNVRCFNLGLSDKSGKAQLWDYADHAAKKHLQLTSQLSSLHREVIESLHQQPAKSFVVQLTALDEFAKKQKISQIDLLKIDTEGFEYQVLMGAKKLIAQKKIKIIQFEFNEMNVFSRVFLRDFMQLLPGYHFYRLMPYGLFDLANYRPVTHELFAYQNIIALENVLP